MSGGCRKKNREEVIMSSARKSSREQVPVNDVLPGEDEEILTMAGTSKCLGSYWTKDERKKILLALRKYGFMNMKALQEAAPSRSEEEIKNFINAIWKEARRAVIVNSKVKRAVPNNKSEEDPHYLGPVDKWLEIFSNHFKGMEEHKRLPLARAFLMIALYEEQPDPSECNGIDFKALYEFLYCALSGFPAKDLNEPTAKYALETLSNFATLVKMTDSSNVSAFLDSVTKIQCEVKPTEDNAIENSLKFSREECFAELLAVPGVNPLGVPAEYLQKCKAMSSDDDERETPE